MGIQDFPFDDHLHPIEQFRAHNRFMVIRNVKPIPDAIVPDLLAGHKAYRSMGMLIAFVNHIRQKASYPALPPRMAIHFL